MFICSRTPARDVAHRNWLIIGHSVELRQRLPAEPAEARVVVSAIDFARPATDIKINALSAARARWPCRRASMQTSPRIRIVTTSARGACTWLRALAVFSGARQVRAGEDLGFFFSAQASSNVNLCSEHVTACFVWSLRAVLPELGLCARAAYLCDRSTAPRRAPAADAAAVAKGRAQPMTAHLICTGAWESLAHSLRSSPERAFRFGFSSASGRRLHAPVRKGTIRKRESASAPRTHGDANRDSLGGTHSHWGIKLFLFRRMGTYASGSV